MASLVRLPLYDRFADLGGRFVEFAGFEMPVRFGSIVEEHQAVRNNVGLFDVSHMGEVEFIGPGAHEALNRIITNDLARLDDGQALYTVMCHPSGGIVDDLLIYRFNAEHYLCCVNASNRTKDFNHMKAAAAEACDVVDRSDEYIQLAVQGPNAVELVDSVADIDATAIPPFSFQNGQIADTRVLCSRTGYTGEDGFELYYPTNRATEVFDALWAAGSDVGLVACGLASRDTLRLEARLMLYGNDINDETTPLEAGLSWLVAFGKGEFIGREALLEQRERGVSRRLRGFTLEGKGVLRPHYPIFVDEEAAEPVGETTSGGPSPTLGKSIALGYIGVEHAKAESVCVEIRGRRLPCAVTKRPFYKRPGD